MHIRLLYSGFQGPYTSSHAKAHGHFSGQFGREILKSQKFQEPVILDNGHKCSNWLKVTRGDSQVFGYQ